MTFTNAVTRTIDVNGTPFVFREIGERRGVPVIFLHHLTAALDDWDPRTADGLAQNHPVIIFDNRGVGGSKGVTPDNVEDMARDAIAFITALGLKQVDLLGFSLGGFVAQVVAQQCPDLVRRIILAGTSAAGGEGIINVGTVLQNSITKAGIERKHEKQFLFFSQSNEGQAASVEFLQRLRAREKDRDTAVTNETIVAQLTAITQWGLAPATTSLSNIQHPVLVVNGDNDVMVPTINSVDLARKLPHAQLSIFPDAGHGAIFEYHEAFLEQALRFLKHESTN